jgi:hypothetical protein
VEASPLLDINYWRCPPHGGQRLDTRVISKATFLANANWVYQRAVDTGVFLGANTAKPSLVQMQGITDVLCGLGWNSGKRKPTKSLSTSAWWTAGVDSWEQDTDSEEEVDRVTMQRDNNVQVCPGWTEWTKWTKWTALTLNSWTSATRPRYCSISPTPIKTRWV